MEPNVCIMPLLDTRHKTLLDEDTDEDDILYVESITLFPQTGSHHPPQHIPSEIRKG